MARREYRILNSNVTGTVKWFNPKVDNPEKKSNFGFITLADGRGDAFCHGNDIGTDSYPLQAGDDAVFDLVQTDKGFKAVNVVRVASE